MLFFIVRRGRKKARWGQPNGGKRAFLLVDRQPESRMTKEERKTFLVAETGRFDDGHWLKLSPNFQTLPVFTGFAEKFFQRHN
ncbi:hypothetical protein [Hymenobacter metallilatus]|uniref:Uncharacterized protein n=1 Tax=Hymenobacter metallilatus TaxID=2493666 RepID=A0A428JDB6_9BACT|nr:hypothetical protein [Hymenobacter metallilatus]RSK30182.1 hypothetical protein EI290_15120 [Hymenobacter metallilatus]